MAHCQDTVKHKNKAPKIIHDTARHNSHSFDSALFADENILTTSDYLVEIEKVHELLNRVPFITNSFENTAAIKNELNKDDSAINIIKQGLSFDIRVLSLRNIQMFQTLIDNLQERNNKNIANLREYDTALQSLKKEILGLRKDSILRHIFHDSALMKSFQPQLQPLRAKWVTTDTLVRKATNLLNNLQAQASANRIILSELDYQTDMRLKKIGPRAFTKEVPYLWQSGEVEKRPGLFEDYKQSSDNLNAAAHYYFVITSSQRLWLFAGAVIFFFWIFYNYSSLKKRSKVSATDIFHFIFVNPFPFASSFIVMLTLAPLLDLNAPAIYLEALQFVLMLILTGVFWKRWPRPMFYEWCVIIALFLIIPFGNIFNLPFIIQRWLMFFVDAGSCLFGVYFFQHIYKSTLRIRNILLTAAGFYAFFNFFAAVANVFGRITLTKILGTTAVYGFAQIVSLTVFVRIITEAFLLQIISSRVRRNYPEFFDSEPIRKKVSRFTGILSVVLWLMAFTTNMNLYDTTTDMLKDFFTSARNIGSFTFTIWGIVLFLGIIWIANSLQKYIAYFFGDTGDDTGLDNKGGRSRLLITRLILLVGGFLLAVAASGLPVDRITVILGALGVGIGLGLQSIVNNFVSGIILIFDRPLRIGDVVELGDKKGRVKAIGIRASTLLTADGAEVIIPNGDILSKNIVNWTLSNNQIRVMLSFCVNKLNDEEAVKHDITKIIKSNENVIQTHDPEILIDNISAKGVQLSFFFWCIDVTKTDAVKSDISKKIFDYLKEKEMNVV